MAKLETNEDLALALRPLQNWSGLEVLLVLHLEFLQHSLVDLQSLVDHSRNFMAVEDSGVIQLMEAGQWQRDEF